MPHSIRFYRQHKVSGLQLVANYCQYNKHKAQLDDAFNPWLEFQQAIKGKLNAAGGIGITETAFNRIEDIRNERPTDVVRAALPMKKGLECYGQETASNAMVGRP